MATTSVQEQAQALLERQLVQARVRGTMSPQDEVLAVLETVGTALALNPRSVLYTTHLARNQLLTAVTGELNQVTALKKTIADLGNPHLTNLDSTSLERAKNSLLQLENQQKIGVDSPSFSKFSSAVDSFLEKQLRKNVVLPGSTELMRPPEEAAQDLAPDLQLLKTIHTDVLDRLYALDTGVDNFLAVPFGSILGRITSSRVRRDLQDMIDAIDQNPASPEARDMAIRLITARAALRLIGTPINLEDPSVDTVLKRPDGYEVSGRSPPVAAVRDSAVGPYVLPNSSVLTVTVPGLPTSAFIFPLTTLNLRNRPAVLSLPITYPVSVPPQTHLFLQLRTIFTTAFTFDPETLTYSHASIGSGWSKTADGRYIKTFRAVLNDTPEDTGSPVSLSVGSFVSAVSTIVGISAAEFPLTGLSPATVVIHADPLFYDQVSVVPAHSEARTVVDTGVSLRTVQYWTRSAHDLFGFGQGQTGDAGTTGVDLILKSFNTLFSDKATLAYVPGPTGEKVLRATGVSTDPGASLSFGSTAAIALGLIGVSVAASNRVILSGTVLGVPTDPVSPIPILEIGDELTTPTGTSIITTVNADDLILADELTTFNGPITGRSSVLRFWKVLQPLVHDFVSDFIKKPFSKDLAKLESIVVGLTGTTTAARRNEAAALLLELETLLQDLSTLLQDPTTLPYPGGGAFERQVVQTVINTLEERKYNRALDFLLRCKLVDIFSMDSESVSFGGNFLKTAAAVASQDLFFPNPSNDEGSEPDSTRKSVLSSGTRVL